MRGRRPEQFSDSVVKVSHELTEDYLTYVLGNLTAQRRENAFENFARFLCQREVCPNILPQTGPVGGGDSKTDGSTYPVDPSLAETWPWYLSRNAASEYWAFAFSTKEDWRSKAKDDMAKIAALSKRPDKVFFVTSQPVRDKARAEVIDHARTTWNLDLTILDRTWLVERTMQGGHQDLVSDALGVALPPSQQKVLGPLDSRRQAELTALEAQLAAPGATAQPTAALVEDYLLGARLCRGLASPKHQTLGFLDLARRTAIANGSEGLIIDALYQSAWTLFWWYDDAKAVNELYETFEERVLRTAEPWYYELLGNIWLNLYGHAVRKGTDAPPLELHVARRERLTAKLREIEADSARPNAAAFARFLRLTSELPGAAQNPERLKVLLKELEECLRAAEDKPFVPVMPALDIIEEFGEAAPQVKEYDDLLEYVCDLRRRREGDRGAGVTLLNRGLQLLDDENLQRTLGYLVRARELLVKHETMDDLGRALCATALVYQRLGLRWAARIEFLRALVIETRDVRIESKATRFMTFLMRKLARLDLELGRLPSALAWRELALMCANATGERDLSGEMMDDMLIALSLLHSDPADVPYLGALTSAFKKQELVMSHAALLFLLGHVAEAEAQLPEAFRADGAEETFRLLGSHPAGGRMTLPPLYGLSGPVSWTLDVRPSHVQMVADTHPAALATAEHVGGLIEILVHALSARGALPMRSAYSIRVRCSTIADDPPRLMRNIDGRREFDLDFAIKPDIYSRATIEAQDSERTWLGEAAFLAAASVLNLEMTLVERTAKEGVLGQVFSYPAGARSVQAIFPLTRYCLQRDELSAGSGIPTYQRTTAWVPATRTVDPPRERFEPEFSAVGDAIRTDLWDAARWLAMGYVYAMEGMTCPQTLAHSL